MSINHLNAGAGPVSSTTSLDNIGFASKAEGDYNKEVQVSSGDLAKLLGVKPGEKVYVASDAASNALKLLNDDDTLSSTHAVVYEGPPSRLGTVGDFLWGTKVREN